MTLKINNHGGCGTLLDLVKKHFSFRIPQYGYQIQELNTTISKRYIMIVITIVKSNKKVKNKKIFAKNKNPDCIKLKRQ